MAASTSATVGSVDLLLRGRRRELRGRLFEGLLLLTLLVALLILATLLVSIIRQGWPVFAERGVDFLTAPKSTLPQIAGVAQGLVGSLILMGFVAILAFPLGIGAAVYLEEYARDTRLNRLIVTNIRNLAGVPAIVYGILGLIIFVDLLRGFTGPGGGRSGTSYISGGLTLAVLVMPLVIITTMEALRAVPQSIREAAYGVGATRWEVVRSHVLPYAAPGVLTGTILSLARAFGETAPLLLVGAVTGFLATGSGSLLETLRGPYTTLPTIVFDWSRQPFQQFQQLTAAAIMVLLGTILVVNSVAIVLRNRYERKW
jgi:phosphate transport system permease protein